MWAKFRKFLKTYAAIGLIASSAYAAPEDICPGGASPRADIQWCQDFESLTNCITGQEALCQSDNGVTLLTADISGFKIKTCPVVAAIGNGCLYGSGKPSGTGPGYTSKAITGNPTALNFRSYVRFGDGYMQSEHNVGNHGPQLQYANPGSTCSGGISVDWTHKAMRVAVQQVGTGCLGNEPGPFNLNVNLGDFVPMNGKWYAYEMRAIMNTTATACPPVGPCGNTGNGILEVWIDNVKILSYNNVNFRGNSTTSVFTNIFPARSFFGVGIPRWQPNMFYDGQAVSVTGTYIGPSVNANALGTGDSSSPYPLFVAGDGAEEQKLSSDCSTPGSATKYAFAAYDWRNGKSYVTSATIPMSNQYPCDASCSGSGCTGSHAMKVETTGAAQGAGIYHPMANINTSTSHLLANHGRIYIPTLNSVGGANDLSTTFPLSGFARYCAGGGGATYNCYLGLGVSAGKWALALKRDSIQGTPHVSATPVTLDQWHEYQVEIGSDNKISLWIDGVRVIDNVTANQDVLWSFQDTGGGEQFAVTGIIHDSPPTRFTAFFDDYDLGTASFVDCRAWGSSCPFGATPPVGAPWGLLSSRFGRGHR